MEPRPDRRTARTRRALLDAFVALLAERSYEEVSVSDVTQRADVGRSTFYQHFRGKEDLLHHSMKPLLAMIAEAADPAGGERTRGAVAHLWERRKLARMVFAPAILPSVRRSLTDLLEKRVLSEDAGETLARARAVQMAAAQLALLEAWLKGELSATPDKILVRLRATARL